MQKDAEERLKNWFILIRRPEDKQAAKDIQEKLTGHTEKVSLN